MAATNTTPTSTITGAPLGEPADCTIACAKGHLTAHKLVLCEHSKYLEDILSNFPTADHPIIILTDLDIRDIKVLVNYMYTGELVISGDTSPTSLLRAAQILKIDSLLNFDDEEAPNQEQQQQSDVDDDVDDEERMEEDEEEDDEFYREEDAELILDHHAINSIRNIYSLTQIPPQSPANNQGAHPMDHEVKLEDVMAAAQKSGLAGFGALSSLVDNKNNKIRCHLCNIGLSDVKCLYRHVLTRHLPEKWGYKCEFCDREFSRDDHLMRHYTTKHKNMEFNREKIRETRRLNREMAKNFHDTIQQHTI